jgi:asparagine synthase (glutamine-hydrolysing)
VNANTGAKLGASNRAKLMAKLKLKVFAKLGVKGYQPYERLGLWLRRELKPTVRRLLLDDRCLSRGIFNPETVRTVVDAHFANRQNHTFLLMAMMIFELGQREFVDGDAYTDEASPPIPVHMS